MAGPGGGPPRKSHTKSRKGCRMCKKRHIRCDEHFPQCRNCSKHSVRCDYLDVSKAGEEPAKGSSRPELLTSPRLQQALDNWRLTGESPLGELRKSDTGYWTRFSTIDLRLIHHITTLSSDMYRRGYSCCTPWTPKASDFITVALTSDFTMNALLAMSATHLAWRTKNSDTRYLASHHRGIAFKGLNEALTSLSAQTSEAVLTASMLLSWQANDWRSWVSLQQGISTVMSAMQPWTHQSELAKFVESQRSLARTESPLTPSISGLPPQQPTGEELQRLNQMIDALRNVRSRLSSFRELVEYVDEVLGFAEQTQQDYPFQYPDSAFERLTQLRAMIFWLPTIVLGVEDLDLGALTMMTYVFALALVLEPLFPEIEGIHLGNISLEPLEKICQMLQARVVTMPHDTSLQAALSMVEIPMQVALTYRANHRSPSISSLAPFREAPQEATYTNQGYTLPTAAEAIRHVSFPSAAAHTPFTTFQHNYTMDGYHNAMQPRQSSVPGRALSTGSPFHSVPSQHHTNESPTTNIDYYTDPSAYQSTSAYGGSNAHEYQSRSISLPRPVSTIPSNASYSTMPPRFHATMNSRDPQSVMYEHENQGQQFRHPSHGWG